MNHEKVALVFGGARGIGAAIAVRLAHEGYRIAITWVSRPDRAQALVSTIERQGGQAIAIEADSADAAAIQAAVDTTLQQYGRLDVAVVNAGVLRLGTIEAYSLADLDATLAVNVRGVLLAIQAAVKQMAEGGRVITNIQPGPIATDMTAGMAEQIVGSIPLQRMGEPDEIASLAAWLAGESSGYMTGTSLTIDGGFVL